MVVPPSVRKQRQARAYLIGTVDHVQTRMRQEFEDERHRRELKFLDEKLKKLKEIAALEKEIT